jgi:hypothetical protein
MWHWPRNSLSQLSRLSRQTAELAFDRPNPRRGDQATSDDVLKNVHGLVDRGDSAAVTPNYIKEPRVLAHPAA